MEHIQGQAKRIDVLPMVKHYIDALELYPLFQKHIPKPSNSPIEPAQVLCMMVANIICASKPLYKVEEWLADYTDGLSEEHINAKLYNDDQLGRTIDKLFNVDRHSMMTELSVNAIKVHNLETNAIHNDSTSVTFCGAYEGNDKNNSDTIHLTQGFNKDHRPDCKQIVFGLNITEDGHVPLSFQLFDGNTTDDTTHIPNWNGLRSLLAKEDFIYIADCKLSSMENLAYIDGADGLFITIIPKNRKEVQDFYQQLEKKDVQWEDAYTSINSRKKGEVIIYKTYEGASSRQGYRIIWVHSSTKEAQDKSRREHKIEKIIQELKIVETKLNRYSLKTKNQIEARVKKICAGYRDFFTIEIIEKKDIETIQAKPGKPGPHTRYIEREKISYHLEWTLNEKAIEKKSKTDGIYPLITNTDLPAVDILKTYKKQPYLEKRMYTTKSILEVAPVFLKLPRRIEALMFLYFVALMIVSLMERNIRKNMAMENIKKLAILPQGMNTKRPTWNNLNYFFRNVYLSLIVMEGKVIKTTVKGMTVLHYEVARLLEVSLSSYKNLKDGWWQFETG
ncbi:MAG: IS1634 family transposase [Deltaproteobacteria bacterium]|nr:IS1634 family transposase [Deltaproteobacteria bacterium]